MNEEEERGEAELHSSWSRRIERNRGVGYRGEIVRWDANNGP